MASVLMWYLRFGVGYMTMIYILIPEILYNTLGSID